VGACAGERDRNAHPNPLTGTRDDGYFPVKLPGLMKLSGHGRLFPAPASRPRDGALQVLGPASAWTT
jgi:hypothetical protein